MQQTPTRMWAALLEALGNKKLSNDDEAQGIGPGIW